MSAVARFNLSTRNYEGEDLDGATSVGIWDGRHFVFTQSDSSYEWWDAVKMVWKYGMSPIRTQQLRRDIMNRFFKLYSAPIFPFKSIGEAALKLGLLAPSETSGQLLEENGIYPPFSTDIIQAATRVNYAQNLAHVHGLEAMVCMATDGAMSVYGGNWQIFDGMLKQDRNTILLSTSVTDIALQEDGKQYLVKSLSAPAADGQEATSPHAELFDAVVLAAPLQFSNITITPTPAFAPSPIPYVMLHVTLFTSPYRPNPSYYGLHNPSDVPTTILTTLPPDGEPSPPFFSFSTLRTVMNANTAPPRKEFLYKLFSPRSPSLFDLYAMLDIPIDVSSSSSILNDSSIITWQHNKMWHSYPYLSPRVTYDDPQLDENGKLWYTSGIESFISTMETSSLMGHNVAQLIVDGWSRELASMSEVSNGEQQRVFDMEED